jgi:hypothetical protein
MRIRFDLIECRGGLYFFFLENEMSEINWDEADLSGWTIADLRDAGCAVCIFNPDEIEDASVSRLEDRLCELGWDVIEDLQ